MSALALPAAAGLALVALPLAQVMIGKALAVQAAHVTPWIALSALFAGLTTYYFHTAFTLARRTGLLLAAMAVPAAANLALTLALIPRFGLDGAMIATALAYGIGLVASFSLGRRAIALPVPLGALARAGTATAAMALAVANLPAMGGLLELFEKAGVGVVVYALAALALDVMGCRSRGLGRIAALKPRLAA
jgi:O-antigen/teichoic acid export membrane protein